MACSTTGISAQLKRIKPLELKERLYRWRRNRVGNLPFSYVCVKYINIPTKTLHDTRLGDGPLKRQRAGECVRMTLSLKTFRWCFLVSNSMKCQLMYYIRSKILPIRAYCLRHFITLCIRNSRFPLTRSFPSEHYIYNQKFTNAIVETRFSWKWYLRNRCNDWKARTGAVL
jgi:hypothetical protein